MREERWSAAAVAYRRALENDPRSVAARLGLAQVALEQHDPAGAVSWLEEARGHAPDRSDVLCELGEAYRRSGRTTDAIEALTPAFASDPSDSELGCTLADLHRSVGDTSAATKSLRAVLDHYPECADAWRGLAEIAAEEGECEPAVEFYRRALQEAGVGPVPYSHEQLLALSVELAIVQSGAEKPFDALDTLESVAEEDPQFPGLDHALATVLSTIPEPRVSIAIDNALIESLESRARSLQNAGHDRLDRAIVSVLETRLGNAPPKNDQIGDALLVQYLTLTANRSSSFAAWILTTRRWLLLDCDPQRLNRDQLALIGAIAHQAKRTHYPFPISHEENDYLDLVSRDIDTALTQHDPVPVEVQEMLLIEGMYRSPSNAVCVERDGTPGELGASNSRERLGDPRSDWHPALRSLLALGS